MTPAARITAALLLGVIVVSFGYLFQQHRAGPNEYLLNGEFLNPREADRIETAFAQANLSGYVREGGRFRVPSGQKAAYLAAIADAGALPANFDTLMSEALTGSPFDSRPIQQQRIKSVLQRQLSMIVSEMDGVEHANVLYDVQEAKGFQKRQVSATVSVRPAAGETLTAKRSQRIRAAIAGAIGGLQAQNVEILNLADSSSFLGGMEITPDDFDRPYFQNRTKYEQLMQHRITALLHKIPGINVQVSADLDPIIAQESRTLKAEGDAVQLRERNNTETISNTRQSAGQRPGLTANGPNGAGVDENAETILSKTEINDVDNEFFPPTSEQVTTGASLVPTDVRVAVAIPSDYALRVWKERNPDAAPDDVPSDDALLNIREETKTAIQNIVKPLLPEQIGKDEYNKVIQVSYFQSLTPDVVEGPSMANEALFWAGKNANTLLTAGFALFGLVMLRSMVKSIPPTDPAAPIAGPMLALETTGGADGPDSDEDEEEEGGEEGAKRRKLKLKKGSGLRDDLTEIVREDPDAAAAILRSWISNAG